MCKRLSLLALATFISSAAASTAMAADLAPPPPPPPAPEIRSSITDWTGPYIGAVVGGTCIDTDYIQHNHDTVTNTDTYDGPYQLNGCGVSGGFVGGFNYQIDNFLVGLEGDFSWGSDKTGKDYQLTGNERDAYNINWKTSVRLRAGLLMNSNTLAYVTGGVGWLRGEVEDVTNSKSIARTHVGFVVGGGLEHALTENIHLRAEYLYSSYKSKSYGPYVWNDSGTGNLMNSYVNERLRNVHTFRIGATWNFPVSTW